MSVYSISYVITQGDGSKVELPGSLYSKEDRLTDIILRCYFPDDPTQISHEITFYKVNILSFEKVVRRVEEETPSSFE